MTMISQDLVEHLKQTDIRPGLGQLAAVGFALHGCLQMGDGGFEGHIQKCGFEQLV